MEIIAATLTAAAPPAAQNATHHIGRNAVALGNVRCGQHVKVSQIRQQIDRNHS